MTALLTLYSQNDHPPQCAAVACYRNGHAIYANQPSVVFGPFDSLFLISHLTVMVSPFDPVRVPQPVTMAVNIGDRVTFDFGETPLLVLNANGDPAAALADFDRRAGVGHSPQRPQRRSDTLILGGPRLIFHDD